MSNQVCIGRSMRIEGELIGRENLVIEGAVEGKIRVTGHQLTVGESGQVTANIQDASTVLVQGRLVGNVSADHKIEIGSTGLIFGDIRAPRVVLAEGARFKGSIDMETRVPAAADALPKP